MLPLYGSYEGSHHGEESGVIIQNIRNLLHDLRGAYYIPYGVEHRGPQSCRYPIVVAILTRGKRL